MKNKIIGIAVLIIGIALSIYSVSYYDKEQKKQKTYIETVATIVGYEDCELDDGDTGSRYIAEYRIDRNIYKIKANSCTNMPKAIGKKVNVKYNPQDPSEAIFANDISRYILPIVGIIFMISGIIIIKKEQ